MSNPAITREAFLDKMVDGGAKRDGDGFTWAGRRYLALRCYCGEGICEGWAKVKDDPKYIADHMQFHGSPHWRAA